MDGIQPGFEGGGRIEAPTLFRSYPLPVIPGLVPGISFHRFRRTAAWIPGTSPGMTEGAFGHDGGVRI